MDNGSLTIAASATLAGPYIGLRPFSSDESRWFFGRGGETQTIIANLRAGRLTVLYAQSGVGKTSLLQAGVVRQLTELAESRAANGDSVRYVPVFFREWKDDPVQDLVKEIRTAVEPFLHRELQVPPEPSLATWVETAATAVGAKLLIVLDQFEEYLLYRAAEPPEGGFADELAGCLNEPGLRANFLLAIREDAYSGLGDLFAGKIANVYGNYLQLQYLDRDAARESICGPIDRFNEDCGGEDRVEIDPELVETVLVQVAAGEVILGQGGEGAVIGGSDQGARRDEIETPYLQLVMKALWDHERGNGSRLLSLNALQDLGGAQAIVRSHLDRELGSLPEDDRDAAVEIFRHLVTPSGAKIVYAASDLAEMTNRPTEQVARVLDKLEQGDARIVRHVPPPAGKTRPDDRYEIFHDVLAPAIVDWRRRALEVRRQTKERANRERLQQEKDSANRRARRWIGVAVLCAVLAIVAGVALILAARQTRRADRNLRTAKSVAVAAGAQAKLSSNPNQSALLALHALSIQDTPLAEQALRAALPQLRLKATFIAGAPLSRVAFNDAGTEIVTAGADDQARLWSVLKHGPPVVLRAPPGKTMHSAAFSRNGSEIVTASDDGVARIWDVRSHRLLGRITEPRHKAIVTAAFSPDGSKILTASTDGTARLWNARNARQLAVFGKASEGIVESAAFNPAGTKVVTANYNDLARIWRVTSGHPPPLKALGVKGDRLASAEFNLQGNEIVTAGLDGVARVWNIATEKQVRAFTEPDGSVLKGATFSPNGQMIATASYDGTARILSVATGRQLAVLAGHGTVVTGVQFGPDGRSLVTSSGDGTAKLWNALPPEERGIVAHTGVVTTALVSPDGKRIFTASPTGGARAWSVQPRHAPVKALSGLQHSRVASIGFGRDGSQLMTATQNGTVQIWTSDGSRVLETLRKTSGAQLFSAALSPNTPEVVAIGLNGRALVWDLSTRTMVGSLHEPERKRLYSAAFNPVGTEIVTASGDGTARIWNAQTDEVVRTLREPGNGLLDDATFSPNGQRIVTASLDGTARIWTATAGHLLRTLDEPGNAGVTAAIFSRNGDEILTASADGTARIWNAETGQQLTVITEPGRFGLNSAMFADNGTRVITASADGSVRIWSARLAGSLPAIERIAEIEATGRLLTSALRPYLGGV